MAAQLLGFGDGRAVGAGVAGGGVYLGLAVVHDGVAAAHSCGVGLGDGDLMALRGQLAEGVEADSAFDDDVAAGGSGFGEARGFEGGLEVHAVIGNVAGELGVGEGLVGAAHDAEADGQVPLFHHAGDDRMEGPFAGGEGVGGRLVEAEAAAAVVEMEAHAVHHDAGGPHAGDALDPAGDVAVFVDHREVRRVAGGGG